MTGKTICGERHCSRDQINDTARHVAAGFVNAGVKQGDAVALFLRNDIPFLTTTVATSMLEAVAVPINWHFTAEETAYILSDCEAKVLVIHADLWRKIGPELPNAITSHLEIVTVETPQDIAAACRVPDDARMVPEGMTSWDEICATPAPWAGAVPSPASSMIYTSGTTGNPKGVLRLGKAKPSKAGYNAIFDANNRMLLPTPVYHSAPNRFLLASFHEEGEVVLVPRFDPEDTLRLIEKHKITASFMVPTMFNRLLKLPKEVREKFDLSSLKHIVCAGAPFARDIKAAMVDWWGPVIFEFYGSTETGALTYCNSQDSLDRPGTVGRAVEGATIRVLDADGHECPSNTQGEVFGRLDHFPEFTYLKRPKDRAAVEKHGLITSGDIGYVDDDGYLFLSDRKNDMVISGGVNIYPAHIEAALLGFDGLLDCAVFGVPHPDMGEALVAAIQMEPGRILDQGALRAYLSNKIAKYMIPEEIVEDANLPRDDSGKIYKRKLRDAYWGETNRKI